AIGAGAFLATRSAARAKARALDAGRRRFLAGAGSGAGAALAAMVAAGATAAARALFAPFSGHGGWREVGSQISSDAGIVKTDPEWKQAWQGSRVQAHRRLGRTG